TGGQVSYTYITFPASGNRWVNTRTAGGGTWTLTPSQVACSGQTCNQTTVTTPNGDDQVYLTALAPASVAGSNLQIQYFSGSSVSGGSLLATQTSDYLSSICPYKIRDTFIWPVSGGTLNSKTEYAYDGACTHNLTARK